jgi:IS605 OrfB family transposase
MLVFEAKLEGEKQQYERLDEAIRTARFIRNSCIRYWMDNPKIGRYELSAYCAVLALEFPWASKLNSMARQASAERAWSAIARFYDAKARNRLSRKHLKVSRQRKDFAVKKALCVIQSNDLVAYEDLQVRNMVRNRKLSKSISDAAWSTFRQWLEYFGKVFGVVTVAVPPHYRASRLFQLWGKSQKVVEYENS